MNRKYYKFLHYLLILLMMVAPLRGVIAAPCDMTEMNASSDAVMMGHDMSAMLSTDSMESETKGNSCCDDISINCSGDCDMGINVSLVLQGISYSPVYQNSFSLNSLSYKILFRELTPPSRPPASLHS